MLWKNNSFHTEIWFYNGGEETLRTIFISDTLTLPQTRTVHNTPPYFDLTAEPDTPAHTPPTDLNTKPSALSTPPPPPKKRK